MLPLYCTREQVQQALEISISARDEVQIDDAIAGASRDIDRNFHRHFYPLTTTRNFDWPRNRESYTEATRLWLDQNELISVDTLTVAGEVVSPSDIILYPSDGPPFTRIEINADTSGPLFMSGDTWQNAISIQGVFGFGADERAGGELSAAVTTTTETTIDVSDPTRMGVGDMVRIGTERMIVTDRTMLDTGQTWISGGDALSSTTLIDVADGSLFHRHETILMGSERMRVIDVAGNNLIVERASEATVLQAHAPGAAIFSARRLEVVRGVVGTVAATHSLNDPIFVHRPPDGIRTLCLAEAITNYTQERGNYARVIGAGKFARETLGEGINAIREATYSAYGRKFRTRAV